MSKSLIAFTALLVTHVFHGAKLTEETVQLE